MANISNLFDPRPYMEMAIEEMRKSQNEPRPDGKVPPQVGAIIVTPTGEVHRAYRGELREGDHAEYTLIERKLVNVKLDDCILFTTLEPCVERNTPKVACCRRTSNARIKKVYVGVEDPDPTVDGKGIEHMESCGIEVKMFDSDLQKQIIDANEAFIKQAIQRRSASPKVLPIRQMEKVVDKSFEDLSAEALQKFIVEAKLPYQIEDPDFKQYLADLGAIVLNKSNGESTVTMAGVLLFGFKPNVIFKQASLKAHIVRADNRIEQKDFKDALVLLPEQIEEWLLKVLPSHKDTTSFKRKDVTDFPIEVLREAVINAIVHRDYNIDGAKVYLEIDEDKIVVKSPGKPLPAISLEQLNTFKAPSLSRNSIITFVFNEMDYVEEKGFGMRSLKSLNADYGLPLPEYSYEEPYLILTFPRNLEAVKSISNIPGIDSLSTPELSGYEYIKSKSQVSRLDYEQHTGVGKKTAERHIKKFVELGLIEKIGAGKNTAYSILSPGTL
jgi:ATP-dependent DNA helicase RecG